MTQQNIEFKAIPGQFNIDEAQGMVECFVAGIGNKDSVGDVLISGAFTKSLTRRKPRVVWGHNWNDPIGKVLEIYEVAPGDRRLPMKMLNAGIGGLYARVQFNLNSEKGREAFANVAFFGQEQEWSIGYKTLDAIFDPNLQANILKEVELYEVSPVLHGANQLTGTISVKSDETAVLEEEKGGMMMGGMPGMAGRPTGMMHHGPGMMHHGPGMMHHGRKPTPNILEANKPGIGDERKNQLEIELAIRAGSPVKVRLAEENTVIFDRISPEGQPTTYRVSYHFTGKEFMFGKPEKVSVQTVYVPSSEESGSRVVIPSQMPSMPMQVKPSGNAYLGDDDDEYQNIMPKSYGEEKWDFDDEIADLANILSDSLDVKVGRALSAKNMSKLKTILQNLQDVISSAEKDVDTKSDFIIPVPVEQAFETKQLLDPIFDYHRVESHVTEDGIVVTSGVTVEFIEAVGVAEKALGQRLGGGLGKLGRAARGAAQFDPKAWDGDGDGLVQEGTPFQRPAIPGINDRLTGGRVDAEAATRAYRQDGKKPSSKKPNRQGLASMGRPEPLKREGEFHGGNVYDEFNGQYVEGEVIALSDIYGDDTPGYGVVGRYDSDGTGTIDYFYGGDDEEFESIEDAMDFLENVENEAENDRFYNDESFRSLDRVRSAGKPGARPLAGLASSSEVVQRPESVQGEIVSGPGAITPAMKEIQREVDNGWINPKHQEILDEILSDVTPEKLSSEEAGKVLSDVRRKFFEAVNNGELDDYRGVKMQEDNLNDYLTQQISTAIKDSVFETINANIAKEQDSKRRKLLEDNRDDLLDAWGGVVDDGLKRIRNNKPVTDKEIASAKKDSAELRKNVIADLSDGSTTDEPQEFWYRIDDIIMDDPSIDSEELLKELREAVLKGIKEDPDNQALKEIQDELGENENRLKDLVGELEEAKLRSDYYPDTVKSRRALAGGLASRSSFDDEGGEDYDEATGPRGPRPRRGMAEDSVGDAAAENIDRDRNANAVRRGLASQSTVDGPGSIIDRSLSRTGRAPTESGTTMQDSEILKDFLKGMTAKQINEKYRLGGEIFAKKAANREMNRLRRNSQSEANSNMDIVMYRAAGLSPKDTAKLFGISPRDVRKRERKLISALREETDDADLLYLRSGLSLEQVGKLLGEDPIDIRKREITALKNRAQSRGDSGRTGLASGSRQMDMTLDEYIKLEDTLNKYIDDSQLSGVGADEDMQTIENLINKISDSQAANDAIELNDKEIDEYIDTLTRMRDFGPVEDSADKESIDKLIDSLKKTKDSKDGYFESDELRNLGTRLSVPENTPTKKPVKKVRAFRSLSGTINPHKKLDIELDENEIGALRDEVEMLSKFSDSPNVLRSVGQKLEKANNGKFTIEADEYEDIVKSIEQAKSRGKIPSSDLLGVIEQTAETFDGKYSSRDIRGGGLASTNGGKRPNNGAPPDITEAMQKELIFWGKSSRGYNLRLVQEAIKEYDANDGQLPPAMWKRLQTMYKNMGPGSASGGARRSTGKNNGAGRRGRSGLASAGDDTAEGRTARPGAPVARGIGEIAMQAGERGNFGVGKGGTIDDRKEEKFVGLSLDEAKPDNWDQLTDEEKFEWLMYEGHPDKASDKKNAISKAAHEGALKKVLDDIEREERKKMTPEQRRELRDAERDNPSEAELERQRVKREKEKTEAEKPKRTYKPAETAEKAKEVREKELDAFKEWIEDTKIQLGDMDYDGDFNPNTEDIWETVDALIGDNDMTKKSIDDAINALEDYVDTNAPENRYDRASVTRANALLKKLKTSRDKYEKDPWITDNRPGRDGLASSSRSRDGDRPRPGSREMPQSKAKRENEMKNVFDLAQQVVAELRERQKQNADGGRRSRSGLASTSMPKTMITDEATYFKDIETSLQKEIRAAQKADDKKAIKGLTKLQEIIRRDEASKTGSRRTNVGSIYLTPDEADIILEGLMFALDKQIDAGGDKRIEWYSKLIEKISNAAMSTFINKTDRNVI
jgi:HK97 family phage prohead protease